MRGELDELLEWDVEFLMRVVRMRSDRTINVVETLRDRTHFVELADARRDRHHRPDARLAGARNDLIEFGCELGKVEMAMMVDKRHDFLPLGSSGST